MGIKDLSFERLSLDDIIAELDEPLREVLLRALHTRKRSGTSRSFEVSGVTVSKELADDGYTIHSREVDAWRRENVD